MSGKSHDKIVLPTWLRLAIELASPKLIETGFEHDFPIMHPWLGTKRGATFTTGQIFTRYWRREMAAKPNRRRNDNVKSNSTVVGCLRFSLACEGGYADHAHGGAIATSLDEILATIALIEAGVGRQRMPTVELKVRYKRPVPLDKIVMFSGSVVKWDGNRRACMKVCLYYPANDMGGCPFAVEDKKILVECEGIYHVPRESILHGTVPYDEAIRRFGRLSADPRKAILDYFGGTKYQISRL